jgi:hypothetical protein
MPWRSRVTRLRRMTMSANFLMTRQPKVSTAKPDVDAGHGRIETNTATVSTDIGWLQDAHNWPGLMVIGKVARVRKTADKITIENPYHLLSTPFVPELFYEIVRSALGRGLSLDRLSSYSTTRGGGTGGYRAMPRRSRRPSTGPRSVGTRVGRARIRVAWLSSAGDSSSTATPVTTICRTGRRSAVRCIWFCPTRSTITMRV